ncbi:polysaccharide deacetylase family protein [Flavonifractor sp. An82]|uniref:polysaccharide deacetylase family protein n=1 Tax=Flavonifractor sp. An82 TaxID=1965660 RepID=UPI0013A6120E|nr:polysaccharide deacetylase family protein [Flavonifractor sp. An82]
MEIGKAICAIKQRYLQCIWNHKRNNIYFLMFHEVPLYINQTIHNKNFSISKDRFFKTIIKLKETGVEFSSLNALFLNEETNVPFVRVAITFDDVYKSVIDNAVPILNELNIPFAFFITNELIDKKNYISSKDIQELVENPICELGFHSNNHVGLRDYKDKNEVVKQIEALNFEKIIKRKCEFYAYPYGSVYMCPKDYRNIVSEKGYIAAFGTVDSGTNNIMLKKNRFYVPRINVNEENADGLVYRISEKRE